MKRTLTIAALVLAGLFAFPAAASAEHRRSRWGFGFGFGFDGGFFQAGFSNGYSRGYSHGCAPRPVHVHCRAPIYRQVWVPAVYDTVLAGYDHCGRPIYRTVMVRCGYYDNVIVGYRCGSCGLACD